MDPNANLREQREIIRAIQAIEDTCSDDGTFTSAQYAELAGLGGRLAELVDALDGWIRAGGFLPGDWQSPRQSPTRCMTVERDRSGTVLAERRCTRAPHADDRHTFGTWTLVETDSRD